MCVLISELDRFVASHAPHCFCSKNTVFCHLCDFLQLLHIKTVSHALQNYFISTLSLRLVPVVSVHNENKHAEMLLDSFHPYSVTDILLVKLVFAVIKSLGLVF